MADKFSKGSNSSTFKNVSVDIGVIGMQGKAMETQETVIIEKKKEEKIHYQITFEKKKKSSTLIQLKCIWYLLAS